MFKVNVLEKASQDLEDIWYYTFLNWSEQQADAYFNLIQQEISQISKFPYRSRKQKINQQEYYRRKIKSHVIFYAIDDNSIRIVRILHQKMDIRNRLKEK